MTYEEYLKEIEKLQADVEAKDKATQEAIGAANELKSDAQNIPLDDENTERRYEAFGKAEEAFGVAEKFLKDQQAAESELDGFKEENKEHTEEFEAQQAELESAAQSGGEEESSGKRDSGTMSEKTFDQLKNAASLTNDVGKSLKADDMTDLLTAGKVALTIHSAVTGLPADQAQLTNPTAPIEAPAPKDLLDGVKPNPRIPKPTAPDKTQVEISGSPPEDRANGEETSQTYKIEDGHTIGGPPSSTPGTVSPVENPDDWTLATNKGGSGAEVRTGKDAPAEWQSQTYEQGADARTDTPIEWPSEIYQQGADARTDTPMEFKEPPPPPPPPVPANDNIKVR